MFRRNNKIKRLKSSQLAKIKKPFVLPKRIPKPPPIQNEVWIGDDFKIKNFIPLGKCTFLARGEYGSVYSTIHNGRPCVLKVVMVDDFWTSSQMFLREATIAQQMGEMEIGPKVHNFWICKNVVRYSDGVVQKLVSMGCILADKMQMTVYKYKTEYQHYAQNRDRLHELLRPKLEALIAAGYIDWDFHDHNVMLNLDDRDFSIKDVRIVDFGLTKHVALETDGTKWDDYDVNFKAGLINSTLRGI